MNICILIWFTTRFEKILYSIFFFFLPSIYFIALKKVLQKSVCVSSEVCGSYVRDTFDQVFLVEVSTVDEQKRLECSPLLRQGGGMRRHRPRSQAANVRVVPTGGHEEYRLGERPAHNWQLKKYRTHSGDWKSTGLSEHLRRYNA